MPPPPFILSLAALVPPRAAQPADPADAGFREPPAELAAGYAECVRAAANAAGVGLCEAHLLRRLPGSVVKHALLISRHAPASLVDSVYICDLMPVSV